MSLLTPILQGDTEGVKWAKLQRWLRLAADNAGISYTMSYPLSDIQQGDTEGVKWAKLGAWAKLLAENIGVLPPVSQLQVGSEALVNGQQSYDIVFPAAFSAAPRLFSPTLQLGGDNAETFTLGWDNLTANGVRVWLNGAPTAASAGSQINWLAIL